MRGEFETLSLWYSDPLSCLYSTFGTVLTSRGIDALACLGRNCRVDLDPLEDPSTEFYRAARSDAGILDDIAPGLGWRSQWHLACEVDELVDQLTGSHTLIVGVDNYHLPFRPAYHDVHAAHLVIVSAVRDAAAGREFLVTDAQPPAFSDWLPEEHLRAATFSSNPPDAQDEFFSSAPLEGRYLTFDAPTNRLASDRQLVVGALRENLASWTGATTSQTLQGEVALIQLLELLIDGRPDGGIQPTALYTYGWSPQAEAHLCADFLTRVSLQGQDLDLRDVARAARAVGLAWTDLRLVGAYPPPLAQLAEHARRAVEHLRGAYQRMADTTFDWLAQVEAMA